MAEALPEAKATAPSAAAPARTYLRRFMCQSSWLKQRRCTGKDFAGEIDTVICSYNLNLVNEYLFINVIYCNTEEIKRHATKQLRNRFERTAPRQIRDQRSHAA